MPLFPTDSLITYRCYHSREAFLFQRDIHFLDKCSHSKEIFLIWRKKYSHSRKVFLFWRDIPVPKWCSCSRGSSGGVPNHNLTLLYPTNVESHCKNGGSPLGAPSPGVHPQVWPPTLSCAQGCKEPPYQVWSRSAKGCSASLAENHKCKQREICINKI